jgi:hypothetical protein
LDTVDQLDQAPQLVPLVLLFDIPDGFEKKLLLLGKQFFVVLRK